ncbi:MAG: acyltransferase family protein [Muribaculaceae bacterium]|nr:acyltransferase family protein [Muribaculaceae bacterium]
MAQRKAWLDYLKFIAMFLVVVYHTPPRYDNAHEAALFNMGAPVFFFAAGYLFSIAGQKDFVSFLFHRAKQILVPYTTFFIIFYALWLVVGRRMAGPEELEIDTLLPLWQFIKGTPDVVLGPFWFLAALFTMQLIYYPISRYLRGHWPLIISVLLSLSLFIMPDVPAFRYWNLDKALLYMPIYAVGNCCRPLVDRFQFSAARPSLLWLLLAVLGLGFLIVAPLWIDRRYVDVPYVLAPMAVILVLPLYTSVCKWLEQHCGTSGIAQTVAITGITYLALQNYLIGIIKMLIARIAGPSTFDDNLLLKVAIAVAVMMILYPLALFVEHYMPFLLGKPFKTKSNKP